MCFKDSFVKLPPGRLLVFALAFAAVTAAFAFLLESHYPYYFLQDDNRDITLPYFIHGYRALAHGELAQYNFHQFLGLPASFLSYPPAMAAVWLSEKLLGHFWGAVDVLAIVCLYASGLGFFVFCSSLGLEFAAAAFGALAWALCPFAVFTQTSWWIVGAAAACFPWMMYGVYRVYARGDGAGAAALAFSTGALCLVNHPQYAVHGCAVLAVFALAMVVSDGYAAESEAVRGWFSANRLELRSFGDLAAALSAAVRGGRLAAKALYARNRSFFARGAAAVALGWLIGAVTVLPMYMLMKDAHYRSGAVTFTDFNFRNFPLLKWLKGLLWPYGGLTGGPGDIGEMDKLAHLGYAAQALAVFLFLRPAREFFARRKAAILTVAALALFCFVWSLGGFNWYEYCVPFFNRLRWHFRIMLLANFFFCLLAALGFAAAVEAAKTRGKALAALLVALQVANMALFYGVGPRLSFRTHSDKIPASEPLADKLSGGRVITVGYDMYEPAAMATLGFDYATLFGLNQFAGYEVLLPVANRLKTFGLNYNAVYTDEISRERLGHFRVWGVRWYITAPYRLYNYAKSYAENGLREVYRDDKRVIFEDAAALPLVFRPGNPVVSAGKAWPQGNSLLVRPGDSSGGCFIVNWLYCEGMTVSAEGGEASLSRLPTGHMQVCAAPGVTSFTVAYANPYFKIGLAISALGIIAAALFLL